MAGIEPRYAGWRSQPEMLRAASWATLVWIAVFVLRFGIQGVLYLAGESGWLAAANIALGLPLFGVAVLATLAIVRRLAPAARFGPRPGSAAAARIAEPDAPGPDAPGPGLAELDTASADRVQPASPDPEIGS
jgi:hypothetical protein